MQSPLYIDDRRGSGELAGPLRARGVPVIVRRMAYGDVSFIGNGQGGEPKTVGIEVKSIRDVLQCVGDGRFCGHQLPGLCSSYSVPWLLVAGRWRANPNTGTLEIQRKSGRWEAAGYGRRQYQYRDIAHWLMSIEMQTPVRIARVGGFSRPIHPRDEAIEWIHAIWSWWTTKTWEQHKSITNSIHDYSANDWGHSTFGMLIKPGLVRRVAAQLPGVGPGRSLAVSKQFKSIEEMVKAKEKDWGEIEGIGNGTAHKVYEALRGRNA